MKSKYFLDGEIRRYGNVVEKSKNSGRSNCRFIMVSSISVTYNGSNPPNIRSILFRKNVQTKN